MRIFGKVNGALGLSAYFFGVKRFWILISIILLGFNVNVFGDSVRDSLELLGREFYYQGNYEESYEYFSQVLEHCQEQKDRKCQIETLLFLGEVQRATGSLNISLQYYEQAQQLMKPRDLFYWAKLYNRQAATHFELDNNEKGIALAKKSLKICESEGDQEKLMASNYSIISACYRDLEMNDSAAGFIRLALSLAKSVNDIDEQIVAVYNLALNYERIGNGDSIYYYSKLLIKLCKEHGRKGNLYYGYRILSDYYTSKGDYSNALETYKIYAGSRDSIINEESKARFDALSAEKNKVYQEGQRKLLEEQKRMATRTSFLAMALAMFVFIGLGVYFYRSRYYKRLSRHLEIQRAELDTKNAELEDANMVKNKLLSIMAHDFKNPLNSIEGLMKLQMAGEVDGKTSEELFQKLYAQVLSTQDLLDSLVLWSKTQLRGIEVDKVDFDPIVELNKEIAVIGPMAKTKDIVIRREFSFSGSVNSDKEAVRFVVRNLLTNAVKFTASGGNIYVKTYRENDQFVVEVEDSGIGIDNDALHNLFLLKGGHTSGTNKEKGFGLGLSLCKEFAEKLSGALSVKSRLGVGSSFTFRIPV